MRKILGLLAILFLFSSTAFAADGGTVFAGQGASGTAIYTPTPVLGINATTYGTLGVANGGSSGKTVTIQNRGATTAYNFNLPTTAGTAGQVLASGGGGSTAMTWTAAPTFTSFTAPLVIGGATASSSLTLESTSGTGTTDSIIFKTGSQLTAATISTNGHLTYGTGTPTITSGDCGTTTNGTIASGNDQGFIINIASASTTTCLIHFGSTWGTAPSVCNFSPANAAASAATTLAYIVPADITATTVKLTGSVLASTNWIMSCH